MKPKLKLLKDENNFEERLIASLLYRIDKEQDKIHDVYDVAWGLFVLKSIGRSHERLCDEARQIISRLEKMNSEDLSDFLYDYRRAVGVALLIYLMGTKGLGLSEKKLCEICEILVMHSKSSKIGELIGVTFLLLRRLGNKRVEEEIRSLMFEIRELGLKDPAFNLADLMYIAFFSAIIDDQFYRETLELMHKNEHLLTYIEDDPEKLALFLYAVSKVTSSQDRSLTEWCRDQRERVAKILRCFLVEDYLTLSDNFSFVNALIKAVQGLEEHPIVKEIKNGEAVIDLQKISFPFPRLDLVSKMILALYEAGYLRPFTLSKKEADAYRQIRAELSGYRRVRKYELAFVLASSILFILLLPIIIIHVPSIMANLVTTILSLWSFYVILYITLIVFIVILISSIWKRGYITSLDLRKMIEEIIRLIRSGG